MIHHIFFILMLLTQPAVAAMDPPCFDFTKLVKTPLKKPLPLQEEKDASTSGIRQKDVKWASARGIIQKPISEIVDRLLDPRTIKGPENRNLEVFEVDHPPFFAFREVKMKVKPVPFITVQWTEEWAYSLLAGSQKNPESVLISYQKTEGTHHIQRFCGSVLIKQLSSNKTDIAIYEELKSSHRTPDDIAQGNLGTLRALREAPWTSEGQ